MKPKDQVLAKKTKVSVKNLWLVGLLETHIYIFYLALENFLGSKEGRHQQVVLTI